MNVEAYDVDSLRKMVRIFVTSFIKGVLDNPIYCGKLAFGRRKNEKVPGTRKMNIGL